MTRREAREHCFKMLFSADFYPDKEEAKEQLAQYANGPEEDDADSQGHMIVLHKTDLSEEEAAHLTDRVSAVMDRIPEIDAQIDQVASGWKTRRMGKVELTILRLAVCEICFEEDIPAQVSANEAVELAKKYGAAEDAAFVNGVLASVIRDKEGDNAHEQP